jgi:hypothetical protein
MLTRPPNLEKLFPEFAGQATTETFAAALGIEDTALAGRLVGELRRLSVLAEVADTVTQKLSLDHQLPRLIDLIAEALDAERATLFLYDKDSGELFSRVLRGEGVADIRIPPSAGISGAVFTAGVAEIVPDAYSDPRFNQEIDRRTGYRTRNILCVPLRDRDGQPIGVTQVLNKPSAPASSRPPIWSWSTRSTGTPQARSNKRCWSNGLRRTSAKKNSCWRSPRRSRPSCE